MTQGIKQLGRVATITATNLTTKPQQSIEIEGLRVVFDISKTPKGAGNKAKIQVYNLSPSSRKLLEAARTEAGDPQILVELKSGYVEGEQGTLFKGLCEGTSAFTAPNWVTTLTGEDGKVQFRFVFEKKYSKGTPIKTILEDIAKQSSLSKFSIGKMTDKLKKSRTFSGPPLKVIESLRKTYGFTFDIQDEGAIIRADRYALDQKFLIKMDYEKGLLGEPRVKGDLVIIDTLINANIRPNSYIDLASQTKTELNGRYVIQKVSTKGDNFSGQWTMTVEMLPTVTQNKIDTKVQ